ncbi:MAG: hypothetical protein ACUVXA_01630 [Candidatus Jordarchaeum sp.]|uniref:hypothetical protein n=1 Tax=Candidatus Jordarchaeum sp. TaxID=2823881 RepID=UPI00404B91D4
MKIPIPAVKLFQNYQKIIGEINYAWTTFNLVEALIREMQSMNVISCKGLKNEVTRIYDELLSKLGSIKKSQETKELKKTLSRLEKLEKKLDVEKNSFDSLNKLKKYIEQRKNWVWKKITGEEEKKPNFNFSETIANFRLVPQISAILGMGLKDAFESISDISRSEKEIMEKIIDFIKQEKPEIEDQLKELEKQLEIFQELAQKMDKIAKNHKRFEKILETPHPLFQEEKIILEEICEEFPIDPFFRSSGELMKTYIDLAFWDNDIPAVKRLVNDFVKQSYGNKVPSKAMVDKLKDALKKKDEEFDVENIAKMVLEGYMARFNLFWQVQMMSVELSLLAPEVWKKYRKINNRVNEYEAMKLDINNIEKDLPQFVVEDGMPVMELGTINRTFFGEGIKPISECFGDEFSLKFVEQKEDNVEVKLAFPWLKNLSPSSKYLKSWIRAYTWKEYMEENKEKYAAYQKILGLYGLGAEEEFKRFLEFLREVIHEGK